MKRRVQKSPSASDLENTGSSALGEPVFLAVGMLRRAHGLKGEMLMDVWTEFPERLRAGKRVYVGEQHTPHRIRSARSMGTMRLVHLEGLNAPEDAVDFRNQVMYVRADELPRLPEGRYYHHELIGMTVVNEAGQVLGILSQILETGANDVYVVNGAGGEMLLPAIQEVILSVDVAQRQMQVKPPVWED
jgi:16S rRNA processing protein RimM